jgi:hypothetical protein
LAARANLSSQHINTCKQQDTIMRVSVFFLVVTLSMSAPATAQSSRLEAPFALGLPHAGDINVPIGTVDGLEYLERSALSGERSASALLAVLLQDTPEVEGSLVKSALHFQLAIAAGCNDLEALAQVALGRLSPEERAEYDRALPRWVPAGETATQTGMRGRCLSW